MGGGETEKRRGRSGGGRRLESEEQGVGDGLCSGDVHLEEGINRWWRLLWDNRRGRVRSVVGRERFELKFGVEGGSADRLLIETNDEVSRGRE